MKKSKFLFLVFALSIGVIWSAEVPVAGVLLNQENDDPIPDVSISLKSGKTLGTSDSRGRFDLLVESPKATIVFTKEGYDTLQVLLSEQADILALEITLTPNVKSLGSTKVIGETRVLAKSRVSIEALESIQGLQFDLNEHLSKMPGVAGQSEFTKEISYYGSRTEDLAVSIGALRIPHLRHIDIGFPGNTSVLNPSVFKDVRIHSQNEGGSLDAGLAGRVEYTPKQGDSSAFAGSARLGVINRELVVSGPMVGFDDFIFSYRSLNAFVLEKFGEQFFTTFQEEECAENACNNTDGTDWQLESGDAYLHLSSTDSANNSTRATLLYSWDEFKIDQTLSRAANLNLGVDKLATFEGNQKHTLFSWERLGADGFNYYLGYVNSENQQTFRDTARVRTSSSSLASDAALLGDKNFIDQRYTLGLSSILDTKIAGATATWGLEAQRWSEDRRDGFHIKVLDDQGNSVNLNPTIQSDILRSNLHMKWRGGLGTQTFQLGGWSDVAGEQFGPQAILNLEHKKILPFGAKLLTEAAFQSAPRHQMTQLTELSLSQEKNLHSNIGFVWLGKGHSINFKAFGRYYIDPLTPVPDVFWMYQPRQNFTGAEVYGANLVYEWTAAPNYAWIANLSSTYGTYDEQIQWESNRLLDMANSLRMYPRNDSLLSIIVTHKASIGQPTYKYDVALYDEDYLDRFPDLVGTYRVRPGQEINTYRTDVRMHLDLESSADYLRLKNLRFYTEVNNVFSVFSFPGSQYLGGENTRQRGWTTASRNANEPFRKQLEPFFAPGMGLFVQLGFEGNFGG